VQVYIKQTKITVEETESWYTVSERIARALGMPRWALFWLYPTDNSIQRLGNDDHAYTFNWEEGKQYWWDIIYDPALDRRAGQGREIRVIDGFGRVDTLAVRMGMTVNEIRDLWGKICDFPENLPMEMRQHDDTNYY
jgi:hypothetical protein